MRFPRLPENLVTPYQGFLILGTGGLLAALLWPDLQTRRTLFLQILAVLQGILALQVGEAEHGYGPVPPRLRLARLAFFNLLAVFLALPLVLVYRVETGASWSGFLLATLFFGAHGFVWMGVGHGLAGLVRSDGVRFVLKYGGFILALLGPLFLAWPASALTILPALWAGKAEGWPGFFGYLGLSGVSLGLWLRPRSCQKG